MLATLNALFLFLQSRNRTNLFQPSDDPLMTSIHYHHKPRTRPPESAKNAWRRSLQVSRQIPIVNFQIKLVYIYNKQVWDENKLYGRINRIESFLVEYKELQDEIARMREACEQLRQVNLRRDLDELKATILELEARYAY